MTVADTEDSGLTWPEREGSLNQPRRALVAGAEAVGAALAGWLATWLWSLGVVTVAPVENRPDLEYLRYQGNWIGLAVVAGAVAALLVVDAVRQLLLALRTRSRG